MKLLKPLPISWDEATARHENEPGTCAYKKSTRSQPEATETARNKELVSTASSHSDDCRDCGRLTKSMVQIF